MTELPPHMEESWIGKFLEYAQGFPTPEIFKLWAGISCIMGALERRVWVRTAKSILYPNHYIFLVSEPGVGKSIIINQVHDLWASTGLLKLGPNSATKAAMVDCLNEAQRSYKYKDETIFFHGLQIASREFGTLVHEYNHEVMNFYNDVWDCPNKLEARLRYGESKNIQIDYVQVNMLAGTQPSYLGAILPNNAFGMGFTARLLLVYSSTAVRPELFPKNDNESEDEKKFKALSEGLKKVCTLTGPMSFTSDAKDFLSTWYNANNDAPSHPKLSVYNTRRGVHIQKIAMALAGSKLKMEIGKADLEFALACMLDMEEKIPEIFKGMSNVPTSDVMDELYQFTVNKYMKTKAPVDKHILVHFLRTKVEVRLIDQIMKHMVSSGLLKIDLLTSPERYIPVPKI